MGKPETKNLIIHGDDLGLCKAFNEGILTSYQRGYLTSTSIRVNGTAFEEAVKDTLPQCEGIGFGVHLNIVEGRTTRLSYSKSSPLYDTDGYFKQSFIRLHVTGRRKNILSEIEAEYRHQIEECLNIRTVDHLNSHQHSHAVPAIFELVLRLAREYEIPFVRLMDERFYVTGGLPKHLTFRYLKNLVKVSVLKALLPFHRRAAKKLGVLTNDRFVGVAYTGHMDRDTVLGGLDRLGANFQGTAEVLLHPCYLLATRNEFYWPLIRDYVIDPAREAERRTAMDSTLFKKIKERGWNLVNYGDLSGGSRQNDSRWPEKEAALSMKDSPLQRLRTFAILDETPFHHPTYLRRLITDCEHHRIQALAIVTLPKGGPLQAYMLESWRDLGLREFFLLGIKSVLMRLAGRLPRWLRGNYEGSVEAVAQHFCIPYRIVSKVNTTEFIEYVKSFSPDVLLSSNSLIFGQRLLSTPKVAAINRHSSVLPAYGGILPVFRAVQYGESFTGASVHRMEKKIDRGEVLSRKWLPIEQTDTLDHLYKLAFTLSYTATDEALKKLRFSDVEATIEDEEMQPSYYSYPTRSDWIMFRNNLGRFI